MSNKYALYGLCLNFGMAQSGLVIGPIGGCIGNGLVKWNNWPLLLYYSLQGYYCQVCLKLCLATHQAIYSFKLISSLKDN